MLRIRLASVAPRGSRSGNRVTAERWAGLLRRLGHRVRIEPAYSKGRADLLVALHAFRSAGSVRRFRAENPGAAVVVALTGTDLYGKLSRRSETRAALDAADLLVALNPRAFQSVPRRDRSKLRVIVQSASPPAVPRKPRAGAFEVCVLGHLRRVKDPLRAAMAARLLPDRSRIRVLHLGAAIEPGFAERAREEERHNPRYLWLGDLPRGRALRILSGCRLLAITSISEGGPSALSEAVVCGVPVVATRIAATVGQLGAKYPGLFPVGDAAALSRLLLRCEEDPPFYQELRRRCRALAPRFAPSRELAAWRALLEELRPRLPRRPPRTSGRPAGR